MTAPRGAKAAQDGPARPRTARRPGGGEEWSRSDPLWRPSFSRAFGSPSVAVFLARPPVRLCGSTGVVVFLLPGTVQSRWAIRCPSPLPLYSVMIVHATIASLSAGLPLRFSAPTFVLPRLLHPQRLLLFEHSRGRVPLSATGPVSNVATLSRSLFPFALALMHCFSRRPVLHPLR